LLAKTADLVHCVAGCEDVVTIFFRAVDERIGRVGGAHLHINGDVGNQAGVVGEESHMDAISIMYSMNKETV
jgi:hypothetical protein